MLKHLEHLNVHVILNVVVNMLKLQVLLSVLVILNVDAIMNVDVIKFVLVKVDSALVIRKRSSNANVIQFVDVIHSVDVINSNKLHVVVIQMLG